MAAHDKCEPQVVKALEKAGWSVDPNPLCMRVGRNERFVADLLVRNAADGSLIIIVEVKCFPESTSELQEFYTAVEQYMISRCYAIETNRWGIIPCSAVDNLYGISLAQADAVCLEGC
jgi:hypothetical protein